MNPNASVIGQRHDSVFFCRVLALRPTSKVFTGVRHLKKNSVCSPRQIGQLPKYGVSRLRSEPCDIAAEVADERCFVQSRHRCEREDNALPPHGKSVSACKMTSRSDGHCCEDIGVHLAPIRRCHSVRDANCGAVTLLRAPLAELAGVVGRREKRAAIERLVHVDRHK